MTIYKKRLENLKNLLKEKQYPAILISSPENRHYFSGFSAKDGHMNESSGFLFIGEDFQYLLTDSRYSEEAKSMAPKFTIKTYTKGWGEELKSLKEINNFNKIYFEAEYLTVLNLNLLKTSLTKHKFIETDFNFDEIRAVKDLVEREKIKKALAITEKALNALWPKIKVGKTEKELAIFLENKFLEYGADGIAFETIIATGARAALPHASPSNKKIEKGDTVLIDCGACYQSYCADISRTKIIGPPLAWQKEIYNIVKTAMNMAIENIKPGILGSEIDAIARNHIKENNCANFFGHGLGHGLGLAIHELPRLSPNYKKALKAGEIVTVEPGIYLPDKGGVRLEQLVLVTENSYQLLNTDENFYNF